MGQETERESSHVVSTYRIYGTDIIMYIYIYKYVYIYIYTFVNRLC